MSQVFGRLEPRWRLVWRRVFRQCGPVGRWVVRRWLPAPRLVWRRAAMTPAAYQQAMAAGQSMMEDDAQALQRWAARRLFDSVAQAEVPQ